MKKYTLLISMVMFFVCAFSFVNAQEEGTSEDMPENGEAWVPTPEEIIELDAMYAGSDWETPGNAGDSANCYDYYTFQSVQIPLDSDKDTYVPGEKVIFSGYVENENEQPVVDGNVFVRISRKNENIAEGHNIVSEMIALENIALSPKESKDVSFEWKIPSNMTSGEYISDFFFSVGKKFNLGGLPFSNEIVMGTDSFNIDSENNNSVSINRSETKVNGEQYLHIGDWPRFDGGSSVKVTQPINNTFSEEKKTIITYELYYWDSLDEKDLVNTRVEEVVIPANGNATLEYEISEMNEPVYYLKITAEEGDQKSIVNVRVVSQQERPRLNYPGITKFPLNKGDNFTLFSCFHNSSGINAQGKIVATLSDEKGKEVGRFEHSGLIPSAMSADKIDITAQADYEYLKLEAKAYDKDSKLVDSYETIYDCKMFGNCKSQESGIAKSIASNIFSARNLLIMIFVVITLAVLIVVGINIKKNK